MSFRTRIRKLRRNPAAYFRDSKHRSLRALGALIYSSPGQEWLRPAGTVPRSPVDSEHRNTANQRGTQEDSGSKQAKNALEGVRSLELIFSPGGAQPDLWRIYRREVSNSPSEEKTIVAVFPLGVPLMDKSRAALYRDDGCEPFFLPIWTCCDQSEDLDDIEFRCDRNPLRANDMARELIAIAVARKARALILPYDVTALTRALAIQSRLQGLTTVCHFPAYAPVDGLYSDGRPGTCPIADWCVIDTGEERGAISGGNPEGKEGAKQPLAASVDEKTKDSAARRTKLGVGQSDRVIALLLPPLQLDMSGKYISSVVSSQLEKIFDRADSTDYLFIVAKRRRFGLIGPEAINLLKSKYRRSVVFYDSESDVDDVLAISDEIVCPVGMLQRSATSVAEIRSYELNHDGLQVHTVLDDFADSKACIRGLSGKIGDTDTAPRAITHLVEKAPWGEFSALTGCIAERLLDRMLNPGGVGLDVVAVPDPLTNVAITEGRQKHLLNLLRARRRVYGAAALEDANAAELFVQWGAEPNEPKERPELLRSQFGRPRLYLEDGFIRSFGLWTDPNEPTLSIVLDTRAVYYDALRPSLLEEILNSGYELTEDDRQRARNNMSEIVSHEVSKYNYAPKLNLDFGSDGKRAVLLVDQKAGDMSIKYGGATSETFDHMLDAAIALGDDVEIVIKQHPCAISGGDGNAHYTTDKLGEFAKKPNVHLIGFDVNPYSLIKAVDEVWVVTSGMGFEALMAGKVVRCFGLPFYSNWGLTIDDVHLARRIRQRTLEDVFFVFYILLSRYVDPVHGEACDIETLISHFASKSVGIRH